MTVIVTKHQTKVSKFPGGELHFEFSDPKASFHTYRNSVDKIINIRCDFDDNDDLFLIALAVDASRKLFSGCRVSLDIPYFPYARQDRYTALGTSFSLKIATDFINSLKLDFISIDDPHSVVLPTLLNNCTVKSFDDTRIASFLSLLDGEELKKVVVVSPDAGAVKRAKQVAETFGLNVAIADKKRDPATGKILSTDIYGNIKDGDIILMVDDICDGGRTFIELAKVLKSRYNSLSINLFVTFGIFSKGIHVFEDFDTVEATNRFWNTEGN